MGHSQKTPPTPIIPPAQEIHSSEKLICEAPSFCNTDTISPMLTIENRRLRNKSDLSKSSRDQRNPPVMHGGLTRNWARQFIQRPVHQHRTPRDIILHHQST